jgi:hypothetical protein
LTPPDPLAVKVMAVPVGRGLGSVLVNVTPVTGATARLIVICEALRLLAPSRASTVIVLAPITNETFLLQFAAMLPVAVPPVAAAPLTVTLEIPLPPLPLSVADPLNVMFDVVTVWPAT